MAQPRPAEPSVCKLYQNAFVDKDVTEIADIGETHPWTEILPWPGALANKSLPRHEIITECNSMLFPNIR